MLALVGSGEYLPPMEPVDDALLHRLPGPGRVVCLPTAAGLVWSERIAYWSRLGVDHFTRLGATVEALPVIDRPSATDAGLAAAIAQANFVYLSGGRPDYLFRTLAGSLAWEAIQKVLAAGGVLAGCSAGAMILGERFYGFPGWKSGFNLLPGAVILPHYDEIPERMAGPMRRLAGKAMVLLGIEGSTALVQMAGKEMDPARYEVLGRGGVSVWTKAGKTRYTQGPMPGWGAGQG
jgi:cyanophycinase-like exopeptidase